MGDEKSMNERGPRPLSWYRETYIKCGYRCAYCGKDLLYDFETWMGVEVDHIVPISKGGSDKLSNRVAACSICNGEKGRYLHLNHKKMTTQQILEAARAYVQMKRSKWRKVHSEAIEEFRKKRPTRRSRLSAPAGASA